MGSYYLVMTAAEDRESAARLARSAVGEYVRNLGFLAVSLQTPSHVHDPYSGPDLCDAISEPKRLESSRPGVFCVGDARLGIGWRDTVAADGEGSMAVRLVHERQAVTAV